MFELRLKGMWVEDDNGEDDTDVGGLMRLVK